MKYHIVQVNEKVQDISKKYNVSLEEIVKLNRHINHIDSIVPGMKIRLPILSDEVSDELKDNFLDIEKYYPKVEDFKEVKVEKKIEDEDEDEKEIVELQNENETEEEKSESQQQTNYNQSQYPYTQQYYQPYYNIPQYYQPQQNYNPYYQPNYQIYQQPVYLREEQTQSVSVEPIKQPDLTLPYLKNENFKVDNRVFEQTAQSDRILMEGLGKIEKQSENSPKYFQDPLYTPPYPCHKSIVDDESVCVCKEEGFDEDVKEIRIDLRDLIKKHTKVNKKKDPLDLL